MSGPPILTPVDTKRHINEFVHSECRWIVEQIREREECSDDLDIYRILISAAVYLKGSMEARGVKVPEGRELWE